MRAPALLVALLSVPALAAALTTHSARPAKAAPTPTKGKQKARSKPVRKVVPGDEVLLLSYFKGEGQQGVFLAGSRDGFNFTALNGGKPIFLPPTWPDQNLTRDPSLLYHEGVFHMVWTSGWAGRAFGYAQSTDLTNWSEPVMVQPFPEDLDEQDQPMNIWAPEIHRDPLKRDFFVLFSTTTPKELATYDTDLPSDFHGSTQEEMLTKEERERRARRHLNHRTYIVRGPGGGNFSRARRFLDVGYSVIDPVMRRLRDRWVMVVKQERFGKNLRLAYADKDLERPFPPKFTELSQPILGPNSPLRATEVVEGPSLVQFGGRWHIYCDAFQSGHYSLITSPDLEKWSDETEDLVMPKGLRHGTVLAAPLKAVGWLQ